MPPSRLCQGAANKWSRIESPSGDRRRQILDRFGHSVQPMSQFSRLAGLSVDLSFPFGSRLDAKAASASTAARLALSSGGREGGGGPTLSASKTGFL